MNVLSKEKQQIVIGALAEGNSIRSIERLSGIHRDTIMRLGVRVGNACHRNALTHGVTAKAGKRSPLPRWKSPLLIHRKML